MAILENYQDIAYSEIIGICKTVCQVDHRFRIAKNEEDQTTDEQLEAQEFLKFDENRVGRDFKLYGFMAEIEESVGPALADFALVLMAVKKQSPKAFKQVRRAVESWKQYFAENMRPDWVNLWSD